MKILSDIDKAYIAGLVDGEGSISFFFKKSGRTERRYARLQVKISNTHKGVLEWVKDVTGVGGVYGTGIRRPGKWKPCYDYTATYSAARALLKEILPYMKIKGARARELLSKDKLLVKARLP